MKFNYICIWVKKKGGTYRLLIISEAKEAILITGNWLRVGMGASERDRKEAFSCLPPLHLLSSAFDPSPWGCCCGCCGTSTGKFSCASHLLLMPILKECHSLQLQFQQDLSKYDADNRVSFFQYHSQTLRCSTENILVCSTLTSSVSSCGIATLISSSPFFCSFCCYQCRTEINVYFIS